MITHAARKAQIVSILQMRMKRIVHLLKAKVTDLVPE
jgi:hypothetical protein